MSPAASFGVRWARDNLTREASEDEIRTLNIFPVTCDGDEAEASKRARRYYTARGPGGLTELWHKRYPDDDEILSSCQDAYIVPLRARSRGGSRMTVIRLPAPAINRTLSAKALLARWLMILDIRLREDPTPGDEVVFIDVSDLQPSHLKNHFRGSHWRDFVWCIKSAYPRKFSAIHIINTQRLKTMSLLLLHMGLYPWRRKIFHTHADAEQIKRAMGFDCFPQEGLPYEYGGKAGAMKDLNDEWTKKLLLNSKWLQMEERKYYETELKPPIKREKRSVRRLRASVSYDILTRTHSCRSLKCDEYDEGTQGAYRTLKVSDRDYYV